MRYQYFARIIGLVRRHSRVGGNPAIRNSFLRFGSIVATLGLLFGTPAIASAMCSDPNQQSCSSGYGVSETFFGTGGTLCDVNNLDQTQSEHSNNYCAKTSVGELGVGNSLGNLYQAQAGFDTNREPSLAVMVGDSGCTQGSYSDAAGTSFVAGNANGVLDASTTYHVTANFSVMSYLASGYVVQTYGQAPTYAGGHTLTTLNGSTPPTPGTEGFGMNLVANTGFGHGVQQLPDTTFGFGQAYAGTGVSNDYHTPDQFTYNSGDEIAYSNSSSGISCFYPSYVFDISNTTPAGTYIFTQSIVVTSTF